MKITTADVQKAISYLIEHINADTGEQVVAIVTRMSDLMQSLYNGLSGMNREDVQSLKESTAMSAESRVLISTVASSLKDSIRLSRTPVIQDMAQMASHSKTRGLKMPTIDGLIEASQFIIDNLRMAGDMLIQLNKLFQAFSDAKAYSEQDNSGKRAMLTQKEAAVLLALSSTSIEKDSKKSFSSKGKTKNKTPKHIAFDNKDEN